MKKINENTKMTLTLKQLKALVNEAKKVRQPRYTIAQYCDMKGLDADKLMAAMKAHWSILSPPLTDRTMFLASALDTYAERYADEMKESDANSLEMSWKYVSTLNTLNAIDETLGDIIDILNDWHDEMDHALYSQLWDRVDRVAGWVMELKKDAQKKDA